MAGSLRLLGIIVLSYPMAALLATDHAHSVAKKWDGMILGFGSRFLRRAKSLDAFVESCLELNAKDQFFSTGEPLHRNYALSMYDKEDSLVGKQASVSALRQ